MPVRILSQVKQLLPRSAKAGIRTGLVRAAHFGFRYECPFCEATFRKMLPSGFDYPVLKELRVVGGGYRANSQCPSCGSIDRERLVYLYIVHQTDLLETGGALLHVAPEHRLRPVLQAAESIQYVDADITPGRASFTMDVTDISEESDRFDVVICNHVLEHIPNDALAIRELYRVLKPGGWGILQVPIALGLRNTREEKHVVSEQGRIDRFGQGDHVRLYAGDDYRRKLETGGFLVEEFAWWTHGPEFGNDANRYALLPDERLFVVGKA